MLIDEMLIDGVSVFKGIGVIEGERRGEGRGGVKEGRREERVKGDAIEYYLMRCVLN